MSIKRKRLILCCIFLASLISVWWGLSVNNAFVYDDTTIIAENSLKSYGELFSFYPTSIYLDRPIRNIITKAMYDLFGTDYVQYHAAEILVHLLNTALLYLITKDIFAVKFGEKDDRVFIGAATAVAFFGIWFKSHMAVIWISGINDLFGTTFVFLSTIFFLRSRQNPQYVAQNMLLSVFFFYLAIRTKEMFYTLPFLFVLYDLWRALEEKKKFRLSKGTLVNLLVMAIFFAGILLCKLQDKFLTTDPSNPYYQSFYPVDLVTSLLRYCMMLFDLKHGGFSYYQISLSGLIGVSVVVLGLIAAIVLAIRKKVFSLLFCYFAIGFSIITVLPLVNQLHVLYLYFPSAIMGLLLACVLVKLPAKRTTALCLAILVCFAAGNSQANTSFINDWFKTCKMENNTWKDLGRIDKPIENSTIYVRLENADSYSPFFYGPGSVSRLYWRDMSLKTVLLRADEEVSYTEPYAVWYCYENGHVDELERNMQRKAPVILSVYPQVLTVTKQMTAEKSGINIGIVVDNINHIQAAMVNGEEKRIFYGDDFVSTSIPYEMLVGKDSVSIQLIDKFGLISEVWNMQVLHQE
ncbi:hypothetical protein [Beduinella massiliensis]|uniref:hypothetical protein n=1 Tax=Beduinella massiliensis TaxID=1852363 RepID=UPI000C83DCA3